MTVGTVLRDNQNLSELKSLSVIKFGPGSVLFAGDSQSATLFAFELGDVKPQEKPPFYNLHAIDVSIAEFLGAPYTEIQIKDLAVHPVSQDAYVAVHRGQGDQMLPIIVKVNAKRELTVLDFSKLPHTQVTLQNPIDPQVKMGNQLVARNFTITALAFHGGEVFVSGLSNAEFSSTLYRIPYPFRGTVAQSSIEMYHAMHAQNETRAPIQAMAVLPLGDKPHVLASYTCTPLVTIPVEELKDGAHVKAKTIGELGYGNTPVAILPFQAHDKQGKVTEQVLITHKHRGPMLFSVASIAESHAKDGLTSGVGMKVVAPEFIAVPMSGLLQVADQGGQYLLGLRRDLDSGRLGLLSFEKGMYFRVGEFVSEYQMPGYTFAEPRFQQWLRMALEQQGVV